MKSKLLVVISFNSHDMTFASWHIFTCHNTLRLFKDSHNTKFRIVTVSVMPQHVVVIFSAQRAFLVFGLNIYIDLIHSLAWHNYMSFRLLFWSISQTIIRPVYCQEPCEKPYRTLVCLHGIEILFPLQI